MPSNCLGLSTFFLKKKVVLGTSILYLITVRKKLHKTIFASLRKYIIFIPVLQTLKIHLLSFFIILIMTIAICASGK